MMLDQMKKMQSVNVLVLGDFMLDRYILGEVRRISPEAPVPVIKVTSEETRLGGAGNVVRNIRSLGGKARVLSCIGTDTNGNELLTQLKEQGADIRFLRQDEYVTTITKTRLAAKNQQFLRYDREGVVEIPSAYVEYISDNIDAVFDNIDIVYKAP